MQEITTRHRQTRGFFVGTEMTDDEVLSNLKAIPGVGDQTASMVALFWLKHPISIIDMYLLRLLEQHDLLLEPIRGVKSKNALFSLLKQEATSLSMQRTEWPPWRVLASLYLWICEIGRLHCICRESPDPACPFSQRLHSLHRL